MDTVIYPAKGIIEWFLRTTGYGGITMPWRKVYILEERLDETGLRNHEMVHIEQIDRLGAWKYAIMYLWYLVRYGYKNHPMEIEAREKSGTW